MKRFIYISIINLFLITAVYASTRGKLAGVVIDKANADPLVGVNVYLEGTQLGAATDENGHYVIINIPPGLYTITAEYIGYTTQKMNRVEVTSTLTTVVNFELTSSTLESRESITIVAERPLFRKDNTAKLAVVSGEEIVSMPVKSFEDVVANQAGITTDAEGNLHFRGGRTNEAAFLIDGIPVENPLDKSYGGLIDNYAISELQVLSGTFNAEYGRAMSGVINIVTNEGSENIKARVKYTSAMLNKSPYRKANALVQDANPIYDQENNLRLAYQVPNALDVVKPAYPYEGNFNAFISGPLPLNIGSFFISSEYENANSWLPFGYDFTRSIFGKFSLPLAVNKLSFSIQYTDVNSQPYNHKYKYLPNSYGHWEIESIRYALQYNHVISQSSYFTVNGSYIDHQSLFRVGDTHYREYIFPELDNNIEFVIWGNSQGYSDFKSKTYNLKADWVYQHNMHHEFKSGFELNQYDLNVFDYSKEGNNPDEFFLNQYHKLPISASFYIQDKIEYSSIIINAGIRADYFDVKSIAYNDIENPYGGYKDAKPEMKISPRLGFAYPVSATTVFHFAYGHFFQFPNFQEIYRNLQFLNPDELARAKLALVANPAVKSQKTTSYEFGISQQIGSDAVLKITTYSKDITDLLGTIYVETLNRYAIFTNNSFARVQGLDISLEKRMSDFWSAKLDYTLSVARGNESTPTEEAYNIFEGRPRSIKEFYLDFDRRHDISVNLSLFLPERYGLSLLGFHPFSSLRFSMLAKISSGLPYTPISDDRTKYFEKNSARMPWTKSIDFRLEKFFPVSMISFSVFIEALNIFDWLNPLIVQQRTGKVWDDGKSKLFGTGKDFMHDPSDVGAPRIVRIGASIGL
jgi:outer membrane cobalamin receptor